MLALVFMASATQLSAQALLRPLTDPAAGTNLPASVGKTIGGPSAVFRSGIDLVALNVVVTDAHQKLVTGLTADDFAVFEDGVQQDVSFFAAMDIPLDLAILVDTSASMTDKMPTLREAAVGFASTLQTGDRITIVDIKDGVKVLHPLNGDFSAAVRAIRQTSARGGTALYNGIYLALKDMMKERGADGELRRQAIAVFSDGDDTASLVAFDDVMDVVKQAGIAVYTIMLRSPFAMKQAALSGRHYFAESQFAMKVLAQETGARAFFPADISELAGVYGVIGEELSNQYALGYISKNPRRDGTFRRVVVRITDSPGWRTRTRSGYLSARVDSAALQ
jgi:Ca-activated chloride channel family protein